MDDVESALSLANGDPRITVRRRYRHRLDAKPVPGRLMLSLLGGVVVWPLMSDRRKQRASLDCDPRDLHIDGWGRTGLYHERYLYADVSHAVLERIVGASRARTALSARGASVTTGEFVRFYEGFVEADGGAETWKVSHNARMDALCHEAMRLHRERAAEAAAA